MSDIKGNVEAIIFASGEPVSISRIAQVLEVKTSEIDNAVNELCEKYNSPESGVNLVRLENNVQMCTNPAYIEPARAVLDLKRNLPLSQAALEVLAVIAYNQPVTKAFVEQVRGVDCSGVVGSLMQKGLLEERGRLELPGRPLLYGTTDNFLRCIGLSSISELPAPPKSKNETADGEEVEAGSDDSEKNEDSSEIEEQMSL